MKKHRRYWSALLAVVGVAATFFVLGGFHSAYKGIGIKERESLLRECIRYHRTRDASRIDLSREAKGESEMIVENCGDERWLIGAR